MTAKFKNIRNGQKKENRINHKRLPSKTGNSPLNKAGEGKSGNQP
jgi:hypothetical protein